MKRVLIAAPLRQDPRIFREYQNALDNLEVPAGVRVSHFFIVNDCPEVINEIRGDYELLNTGDIYKKTHNNHIWTESNLNKMHYLRNATIKKALDIGADYLFSVDTDLILHPLTLKTLLDADKDIISEIFFTNGWCNAWMYDQAQGMDIQKWKTPGVYKVGMTGACMLVKRQVLERGVDYTPIPCIKKCLWGEDRHFCIRVACAGFEMYVDTHFPAIHLYTENDYINYMRGARPWI